MAHVKRYISKDGKATWRVRFRQDGRSRSETFKTEDAARWFGEMVDLAGPVEALAFIQKRTEPKRKAHGATVRECVERYIASRPNLATQATYTRALEKHIAPTLGEVRINQLTKEQVMLWMNSLNLASNSILRTRHILSGALEAARDRGEITMNATRRVPIPRRITQQSRVRAPLTPPLTLDEYTLIRKATLDNYRLLVEFLAESGCRFGEAAGLAPYDVNIDTGTVHFHNSYSFQEDVGTYVLGPTKTSGSDRIIPVKKSLLQQLDLSGEFVFTNALGEPVKGDTFRNGAWERALKRSGLPRHRWPHPHDMRHAHVCWLLESGVPLPAIQKRVGHSDVKTTLGMYSHAAADSDHRILAALEALG